MKKILIFWAATLLIVLLSACHKEEVLPEPTKENEKGGAITLSATFPGHEPTTKVALEQKEDRTIALTWDMGDQLELAFVKEGQSTIKQTVTIRDISPNGKSAEFDITLPTGYESGTFDLYGVYGGGGIDISGPNPVAVLPTDAGSATSLNDDGGTGNLDPNSVQARKDVMLYFSSTAIDATAPNISVTFMHLGSLFSVDIFNDSGENLIFNSAALVGADASTGQRLVNGTWAYNSLNSGKSYDFVTGLFQETDTGNNYISFTPLETTVQTGSGITLWAWYPPLPTVQWPALQLALLDNGGNPIITTQEPKPERQSATPAGKAFYLYAGYYSDVNGGYTLEFNTPPAEPDEYHVETMGDLNTIIPEAEKETITRLRLTGSLNAADFIFMKNHMPNLEFLDILDVTCSNNSIPTQAFGDQNPANAHANINEIMLPSSIIEIGAAAFANCTGISEMIMLPPNVTVIREGAFIGCTNLKHVELHNAIETIEKGAFAACTNLGSIVTNISEGVTSTLPTGLITIGEDAFNGCVGLSSPLSLPSTLTSLGARAFYSCASMPLENEILTIPEGITTIGDEAFFSCTSFIGTISLPSTLQIIGENAFHRCLQLNGAINIPASVTTIRDLAFGGYEEENGFGTQIHGPAFSSLTFASGSQLDSLGAGAFAYCWNLAGGLDLSTTQLTVIPYGAFGGSFNSANAGPLTLPNNLQSIGEEAFIQTKFTGSLNIPNSVTTIGGGAFTNCSEFTGTLNIPNSVTSVGEGAFAYCHSFTGNLDLSSTGLTEISWGAFGACLGFNGTLTLPSNLTLIGKQAFHGCQFTGTLTIPYTVTSIRDYAFSSYTPAENPSTTYKPAFNELILENVETTKVSQLDSIGVSAFEGCSYISLSPIIFQPALSHIGSKAFFNCTNIPAFGFYHSSVFPYSTEMFWKDSAGEGSEIMTTPIYVGEPLVATYKATAGWIDHAAYISKPPTQ